MINFILPYFLQPISLQLLNSLNPFYTFTYLKVHIDHLFKAFMHLNLIKPLPHLIMVKVIILLVATTLTLRHYLSNYHYFFLAFSTFLLFFYSLTLVYFPFIQLRFDRLLAYDFIRPSYYIKFFFDEDFVGFATPIIC